jgi:predicted regulator of Ras-like GTPase activity (Roadblock/LC7/MglB family)
LEAALLLKTTGVPLATWTRDSVPLDVLSVMAATMWGSLDTIVHTLGGPGLRSALIEAGDRRILLAYLDPNLALFLVGSRSMGVRRMQDDARRILDEVARLRAKRATPGLSADLQE